MDRAIRHLIDRVYPDLSAHAVTGTDGVNAKAWIKLPGGLTFQPSELVKILFMITYGKHLSIVKENGNIKRFLHVCLLGVHALVPILLVHFQGDDGAAMIFFFMFLFMSFAAGVQLRYFAAIFAIILIAIPIAWQYIFQDYQRNRILNMSNPEADPQGMGLQQIQGKISIGSGQLFGQWIPRTKSSAGCGSHSGKRLHFRRCRRTAWLYRLCYDYHSADPSSDAYPPHRPGFLRQPGSLHVLRIFWHDRLPDDFQSRHVPESTPGYGRDPSLFQRWRFGCLPLFRVWFGAKCLYAPKRKRSNQN